MKLNIQRQSVGLVPPSPFCPVVVFCVVYVYYCPHKRERKGRERNPPHCLELTVEVVSCWWKSKSSPAVSVWEAAPLHHCCPAGENLKAWVWWLAQVGLKLFNSHHCELRARWITLNCKVKTIPRVLSPLTMKVSPVTSSEPFLVGSHLVERSRRAELSCAVRSARVL